MMKYFFKILVALAFVASLSSCGHQAAPQSEAHADESEKVNSIYYWRTVFNLDSAETAFLQRHDVGRIYLRMFDIVPEHDFLNGTTDVVPNATTQFVSSVPDGVEIVPVTYITIEALRTMAGREAEIAPLIVERMLAMCSYNDCGEINELQLDCDWTSSTKESYEKLCGLVKESLHAKGISLSITVRLHQLRETPPPADSGVLMLYNTGALKRPDTRNSILSYDDVEAYVRPIEYPMPLDYAYPVFGWGVKFAGNKFVSIVPYDSCLISGNEHVRYERPEAYTILNVKELVEENIGKPARGNILYHLDYSQFKNYTDDEISEIYSY